MTARRALAAVFELGMLAASFRGPASWAASIRTVAVVVVAALGALVVFVAVVFAVAIVDQRRPRTRSDR